MDENLVILNDEDGNEVRFEYLDLINYEDDDYIVLYPLDDVDSEEVVILKVEDPDSETDAFVSVDDEDTLMAVFEIFREHLESAMDDDDEDEDEEADEESDEETEE